MKRLTTLVLAFTLLVFSTRAVWSADPTDATGGAQQAVAEPDDPMISVFLQRGNVGDTALRAGWRTIVWNDGQIAFAEDWKAADPPLRGGMLKEDQMQSIRGLIDKYRLREREPMMLVPPDSSYSIIRVYEGRMPKSFAVWNKGNGMGRINKDESWLVSFIREAEPLLEQVRPVDSKPIGEVPVLEERIKEMIERP